MQRGSTLLETIMALALLALVVMLLANLYPTSVLGARQAEDRVEADLLAQSLLSEQMSRPFDELVVGTATDLDPVSSRGTHYQNRLEVFQAGGRGTDYLKGLRITVRWTHGEQEREVVHEVWLADLPR
ncbi:MAG: hypothetical protein HY319_27560 [Armatimonadetes bacterium]|nr:hypothetical protein [Armatimonadota bacterium]